MRLESSGQLSSLTAGGTDLRLPYCRLSGNSWTKVLLPQRGDWALYRRTGVALARWARAKIKTVL
jgi:hypothetical protein